MRINNLTSNGMLHLSKRSNLLSIMIKKTKMTKISEKLLRQSSRSRKECHDIYIWITTMILLLRDGKRLIEKFRNVAFCPFVLSSLENKYHCNSSDFFPLLFYFLVPRFIWHAIRDRQRVHLVSMKSKSIFSQITHASRLRFCDNTREYHFSPPSSFCIFFHFIIHSFIYFVSFENSLRNRVVNSSRGCKWWSEAWF